MEETWNVYKVLVGNLLESDQLQGVETGRMRWLSKKIVMRREDRWP
jgi:hypothetical protein